MFALLVGAKSCCTKYRLLELHTAGCNAYEYWGYWGCSDGIDTETPRWLGTTKTSARKPEPTYMVVAPSLVVLARASNIPIRF